ncbi:MAG TPA: DUF6644 family protein [Terriglobia bacterium]|nr:DUF6644 family protein [Terriglobia bacterium]
MDIAGAISLVESSRVADAIRNSLYLFPLIESAHVLGLTMVFGTIAIIDLRLLGIASTRRSFRRIASDVLKWTWAAFALSVVTGSLMFITNANVYYHNFFFRAKMALLLLAGINMLIFEVTAARSVHRWDNDVKAPLAGRTAAALSLVLWIAIIFLGRWTGFTTTGRPHVNNEPADDINIENLLPK